MNDHDHDSPHAAMDQPTRGGAPGPWSPSDGTGEAAIDQTTQSTADLASHSVPPIPPQGSSNSTLLKVTVGMTAAFLLVAVAILGVVLLGGDDEPQFRSAKTANDEPAERSADEEDAAGTTATPDDAPSTNSLVGMLGSTPLVDLDDEFKDRLRQVDPALVDYNYAAESYDAAIVIGLAAEAAGTDGSALAQRINDITRDGEKCTDFAPCQAILDVGGDPDYDGQSGPLEFSGNGEPTRASYGILQFGTVGCVETVECIDGANTEFVMAEAPAKADVPQVPVTVDRGGDGTLKLGSLLPKTGSLAFLGPPEFAGIDLAVREMNAAGGVLGSEVSHIEGDSGDTENAVAPKTVSTLLAQDVDAIIGAPSTSVTLSVIDTVTNAGVVMFSPAATSKTLSDYDDQGLLFRAAPSDILQGAVLAETVAGDGHRDVYILALNDDYGTELADDFTTSFEANGGSVAGTEIYDPKATTFADVVGSAKQAEPGAVLLLGFDETSKILAEMIDQDIGPSSLPVYGVDGNMGNALVENFEAGR